MQEIIHSFMTFLYSLKMFTQTQNWTMAHSVLLYITVYTQHCNAVVFRNPNLERV